MMFSLYQRKPASSCHCKAPKFHNCGFSPKRESHPERVVRSTLRWVCRAARLAHHRSAHDAEWQVPHGKHMLSLITAVSEGWGEEALCLFCSEPQRAGDSGMAALH